MTSGSPSDLPHAHINSFHICFFLLLFPTPSPPPCYCPPPFPPLVASPLPFSFIDHEPMSGRDGGVIKEPDRSVNSAQRSMESTRPSDGPNRASYCKQHAHLDSSGPQGESGGSCCRRVSADKGRKFIATDAAGVNWRFSHLNKEEPEKEIRGNQMHVVF